MLVCMNREDRRVPIVVAGVIADIEKAVQCAVASFRSGGRLIYVGAGTSGRLGVLDAVECVPTFSTSPKQVVGVIAGGSSALTQSVEGAEDSEAMGAEDLAELALTAKDFVVGVAASGRTPYVIGALKYARQIGASTAAVSCNAHAVISRFADIVIEAETGPEVLAGSTRLKAGTAQKLILNMISTASMIGLGKVYQNLMVDVKPSNEKLIARAKRMISEATGVSEAEAETYFEASGQQVKTAIVMILLKCNRVEAERQINAADGHIGHVLNR